MVAVTLVRLWLSLEYTGVRLISGVSGTGKEINSRITDSFNSVPESVQTFEIHYRLAA